MNLVDLLKVATEIEGKELGETRETALVNALKPYIDKEKHEQLDKIVLIASLLSKEKRV